MTKSENARCWEATMMCASPSFQLKVGERVRAQAPLTQFRRGSKAGAPLAHRSDRLKREKMKNKFLSAAAARPARPPSSRCEMGKVAGPTGLLLLLLLLAKCAATVAAAAALSATGGGQSRGPDPAAAPFAVAQTFQVQASLLLIFLAARTRVPNYFAAQRPAGQQARKLASRRFQVTQRRVCKFALKHYAEAGSRAHS